MLCAPLKSTVNCMEELFLKLLQQSPWVSVSAFLIWRLVKQQDATLDAYKAGVESTRQQTTSIDSALTILQAVEKRQASTEAAVLRVEARLSQ